MAIIEQLLIVGLTIAAWCRGWRGWSLIPAAIVAIVWCSTTAAIRMQEQASFLGLVSSDAVGMWWCFNVGTEMGCILVLLIMIIKGR